MSSERKLKIIIAATGGEQAAAEINKVTAAVEAGAAPADAAGGMYGLGGMLDGIPERADEAVEAIEEVVEAVEAQTEAVEEQTEAVEKQAGAMDELGGASEKGAAKIDKVISLQKAQIAAQIGAAIGKMGQRMREAAQDFEQADPEIAATLDNIARGLDATSGALTGAAAGFMVGGPFGAAIGALAGGTIGEFNKALLDMQTALVGVSASANRAAEAQQQLAGMTEESVAAAHAAQDASDALATKYGKETEAIQELNDEIRSRNQLLDARDKAEAARRDRTDASAIRAGADPEDVKARRVLDDAAVAKAKIDRDLDAKRTGLQETFENNRGERATLDRMRIEPGNDIREIEKREAVLAAAEGKFKRDQGDYFTAQAVSGYEKVAIDQSAAGKVEALGAEKQQRLAREKKLEDDKREAEEKRERAKAQAEARRRATEQLREAEDGLDAKAKDAARSIFSSPTASRNKAARGVATALENGTNQEELDRVARQFSEQSGAMGAKMFSVFQELISGLQAQSQQIEVMKKQIRNNR